MTVELSFSRDMTVLDNNNELNSLDTVLMDDNVVTLVKKRYRNTLKKNNGEAFFSAHKLCNLFEAKTNVKKLMVCLIKICYHILCG